MKQSLSIGVRKISNGYLATLRSDDVADPKNPVPPQRNEKSEKTLVALRKQIDKFLDEHLVQK